MKWYLYAFILLIVVHSAFGLTDDFQVLAPHEVTLCACDQISTELTIANIGDVASTYAARPNDFSSPFVSIMPETFALSSGETGKLYQVFSASCSERNTLRTLTTYFQSSHGVNKVLLQNLTIQSCNSVKLLSYTDEQIVCMEDTATYHFTITNIAPYTETYYLDANEGGDSGSSFDVEKYVQLGLSEIAVAPGDTRDVYVYVRPYDLAGEYDFTIDVTGKNSGYASSLTFDLTSGYCNGVPTQEATTKKPFLDEDTFMLLFVIFIIILIIFIAILFCIFLYQKRDVLRERYATYREERARKAAEKDEASETLALAEEDSDSDKKEKVPQKETPDSEKDVPLEKDEVSGPTFFERIKLWWASLFAHDDKEEMESPDAPWMDFPAKDIDESLEKEEVTDTKEKKVSQVVETPLESKTFEEDLPSSTSSETPQSKWPIILIIIIALIVMVLYYFWDTFVGYLGTAYDSLGAYLYYIIAAILLLLILWFFSRGRKGEKNVVDLRDPNAVLKEETQAEDKEAESQPASDELDDTSEGSSFFGVDKTPLKKESPSDKKKSFFNWKFFTSLGALILIGIILYLGYVVIPWLLPYVWYIVIAILVLFLLILFGGKKEDTTSPDEIVADSSSDSAQQTLESTEDASSKEKEKSISPFYTILGIIILLLFLLVLGFAFLYAPLNGDSGDTVQNETDTVPLVNDSDVEDVDPIEDDDTHTIPDDLPHAVFESDEPSEDEPDEISDEPFVDDNVTQDPIEDNTSSDETPVDEEIEDDTPVETAIPVNATLHEIGSLLSYIEKEGLTESFLYQIVPQGSSLDVPLSNNFVDPDGDELFFTHTETEHVAIDIWKDTATLTPQPSFVGIEKVTFYAEDASGFQIESGVVTVIVPPAEDDSSIVQTLLPYAWYILIAIIVLLLLFFILGRRKDPEEKEEATLTDYGFSEKEKLVIDKDDEEKDPKEDFDFDSYLEELESKKK